LNPSFQPPIRSDWDDASQVSIEVERLPRATTPLLCKRGNRGVASLTLSSAGEHLLYERQQSLASIELVNKSMSIASGYDMTMSAPDTVHGSCLKWTKGDNIGRGSLGTVFQAMDQCSGQVFAVKEVQINPEDQVDMQFKADLENEIKIVKDLKHPRIVSYLGHDYMDSCLYIYLEYMAGGSMASVLAQFGALEESLLVVYAREMLEGVEYLHTRDPPVVHRDIKGANVLVGLDCRVKLSDFGCSKRTQETWSVTMKGSIPWMAPEVVKHTGYGRKADIWSFGCVMIEMATADSPWGKFDNPMAAFHKIGMSDALPAIPEFLSDECREFIGLCVQRDFTKRPTAAELLDLELVRDLLLDDA